jgi:Uma2 family endonuclease
MLSITEKDKPKTRRYERKVPDALIYEVINGEPLYYRGYKEVMSGKKTIEEIMGSSSLQFVLGNYFVRLLVQHLDEDDFYIASSEAGVHISHRDNMANDIAVYESSVLTPDRISDKYADVPPKFAIEIDIKADLSNPKYYDYVNLKTQKMLDFGTEKLIWVFTETQKVMVAVKNQDWLIIDWDKDIDLIENVQFNVGKYLKKKNIVVTKKTR